MFGIVSNVGRFYDEYQAVTRWYRRLLRIADILEPSKHKTSQKVKKRLIQYLKDTEQRLSRDDDKPFVDNLTRYSQGFWKGLFTFYNHPLLPRTNNDLELYFHEIKQNYRRITGLRSWSRYIMRHGEYIVFAENVKDDENIEQRLASVPYDMFRAEIHSWESRTREHKKRFRFKRDPETYLKSIEEKWIKA